MKEASFINIYEDYLSGKLDKENAKQKLISFINDESDKKEKVEAIKVFYKIKVQHHEFDWSNNTFYLADFTTDEMESFLSGFSDDLENSRFLEMWECLAGDLIKCWDPTHKLIGRVIIQKMVKHHNNDMSLWQKLGSAYKDSNEHEKSENAYKEALKIEPEDFNNWEYLLELYRAKYSNLDDAVIALKNTLKEFVDYTNYWDEFIEFLAGRDLFINIILEKSTPNEINDDYVSGKLDKESAKQKLIIIIEKELNRQVKIEAIKIFYKITVEHHELEWLYNTMYMDNFGKDEFRTFLNEINDDLKKPEVLDGLHCLAGDLIECGNPNHEKEGILILKKLLKYHSNNIYLWQELGSVYKNLYRYEKAERAYREAIKIVPEDLDNWEYLYCLFYDSGDINNAIKTLKTLLQLDPEIMKNWARLLRFYIKKWELGKAFQTIDSALERETNWTGMIERPLIEEFLYRILNSNEEEYYKQKAQEYLHKLDLYIDT